MTDITHCVIKKNNFPLEEKPFMVTLSTDSKYMAFCLAANDADLARVILLNTGDVVFQKTFCQINDLIFSPDSSKILIRDMSEVYIFDITPIPITDITIENSIESVDTTIDSYKYKKCNFSTDGNSLLYSDSYNRLSLFNIKLKETQKLYKYGSIDVTCLSYSSKYDVIICGYKQKSAFSDSFIWMKDGKIYRVEQNFPYSISKIELDDQTDTIYLYTKATFIEHSCRIIQIHYPWLEPKCITESECVTEPKPMNIFAPSGFITLSRNVGIIIGEKSITFCNIVPMNTQILSITAKVMADKPLPLSRGPVGPRGHVMTEEKNDTLKLQNPMDITIEYNRIFKIDGADYQLFTEFEHDECIKYEHAFLLPAGTGVISSGLKMTLDEDIKIFPQGKVSVILPANTKIRHCKLPIVATLNKQCEVLI